MSEIVPLTFQCPTGWAVSGWVRSTLIHDYCLDLEADAYGDGKSPDDETVQWLTRANRKWWHSPEEIRLWLISEGACRGDVNAAERPR